LAPLFDERAFLVENLDAIVRAIGDKETAAGIHRKGMGRIQFSRLCAALSPRLDEPAVLREFHDPGVGVAAMAIGDEDVAIWRDDHVRRLVEGTGSAAWNTGRSERQEYFAFRSELANEVAPLGGR
jgi:hypothetical protein